MGKCNLHGSGAILEGNASVGDVLSGKTFYNTDAMTIQTGTMTNRGAVSASVAVGGSYTIPAGYHNGSGKVTGPTLSGNAVDSNVLSGKTFYNTSGTKVTGTMTNRGGVSASVAVGGSYTIPSGYHNGSGKVTGPTFDKTTLENFGFTNVPAGQWELKAGTLAYATCNSGSQYIPIALSVTYVQLASTASHTVKYGDITLNTGQEYYSGSARCFCSTDLTKKQITVSGVSSCNVIVWLQKVS